MANSMMRNCFPESYNVKAVYLNVDGPKSSMFKAGTLGACIHHALESMEDGDEIIIKQIRRLSGARESAKTIRSVTGKVVKKMQAVVEKKRTGANNEEYSIKMISKR